MKKLYFPEVSPTHYWEYWDNDDGSFTTHWGELGTEGDCNTVSRKFLKSAKSQIAQLEKEFIAKGYTEIEFEDQKVLLIEYIVDGFGTEEELQKRHSLQDLMNDVIGWTGLGHCDGGSSGSGFMEVCCFVVDFDVAKRVVSEQLKGTVFSDYSRIYIEQ